MEHTRHPMEFDDNSNSNFFTQPCYIGDSLLIPMKTDIMSALGKTKTLLHRVKEYRDSDGDLHTFYKSSKIKMEYPYNGIAWVELRRFNNRDVCYNSMPIQIV